MSIDDIVKERGSTVTEKENDRVKVFFFQPDTIKRNERAQSKYNLNFGSSQERSCGGIGGADISYLMERES